MREFVTRYNNATNVLPKRFEPVASEIFTVDVLPGREFITIVQGKQHGETDCFCRDCFLYSTQTNNKRLCEIGQLVCRSYEREDGRQVVIRERKPFQWS